MPDINDVITYPGWKTVRQIGSGSYGAVYEIERDVFGRKERAALKVISIPQNDSELEELIYDGYDEESISKLFQSVLLSIVQEYQVMADMKGHTNIVCCDDIRCVEKEHGPGWNVFIKMEYLTPLTRLLGQNASDEQVIRLGKDICKALILCEDRNIVHRDIKPQNLFVSQDGDYKLGDFGSAKIMEKTSSGTKAGTYNYMAPEVYNNEPYGSSADLYSLGLVMYWMLNERRLPFFPLPPDIPTPKEMDRALCLRVKGKKLPPPKNGSKALKRIVLKACCSRPEDRYASAAEMLDALDQLTNPVRQKKSKVYLIPVLSIAIVSGLLFLLFFLSPFFTGNGERETAEPTPSAEAAQMPEAGPADLPSENPGPITDSNPVSASQIPAPVSPHVGETVAFGRYLQSKDRSGDPEPIEWRVLRVEGTKALLISEYALDAQLISSESTGTVTWENCELRTWLNSSFLDAAFTEEEKSGIPYVTVSAELNPNYPNNSPGKTTEDQVFLLSIGEAQEYFNTEADRQCKTTAYVQYNTNAYVNDENGCCWWWLRTQGRFPGSFAYVPNYGSLDSDSFEGRDFYRPDGAVRPALWVDLEKARVEAAAGPESGNPAG